MIRNILPLVVDSLRADATADPRETPFLSGLHLHRKALFFSRAYATECWTLPAHVSMFTRLLAREHGPLLAILNLGGGNCARCRCGSLEYEAAQLN